MRLYVATQPLSTWAVVISPTAPERALRGAGQGPSRDTKRMPAVNDPSLKYRLEASTT